MIYAILAGYGLAAVAGLAIIAWAVRLWMRHLRGRAAVMGIAGVVLVALTATIFLSVCARPRECSRRSRCMSNLAQLGKAMKMYAMDHGEEFPSSFVSLTNYMNNPKLYVCPHSGKKVGQIETADQWADYILVTNLTERSPSGLVHAYCKSGNHRDNKGINVLFVDGSVQWFRESDFGTLPCDVLKRSRINNTEPQPPPGN